MGFVLMESGRIVRTAACGKYAHDREIRADDFKPWSYNLHYIIATEPWTYRHHRHDTCFELVFTISGTVEHLLDESWRSFSEGDLLAIGEADFHSIRGRNFSYANIMIPTDLWLERLAEFGVPDPLGSPQHCRGLTVRIPVDRRRDFTDLVDRLFRFQQTDEGERQFRRFLGILLFEVFWVDGSDGARKIEPTGSDQARIPAWWSTFITQIESEGIIPADTREMAARAGRSREHVARTCRKVTGRSPSAWLNTLRTERAALLLRKTNCDIADIAYSIGFGSLEHFYRLFQDAYGLPPGRYRRERGMPAN